jgi:endonuclease III
MNKLNLKLENLKRTLARLIKAAPARRVPPTDPLARLVRAFLEYDCDDARAEVADRKLQNNMVDMNELRVTPAIELASLLGVRYPFAEQRCSALHRTLQSIFDREHQMKLDRVRDLKKGEIRPYFQSLGGISPYVEAVVVLDCFDVPAAPVDTKLLLWLISKDALPEGTDVRQAQHIIEKHLKATELLDFHLGARKELDDWAPKSWPPVARAYSPMLAPPPLNAQGEEIQMPQDPVPSIKAMGIAVPAVVKPPAKPIAKIKAPEPVKPAVKVAEPVKAKTPPAAATSVPPKKK